MPRLRLENETKWSSRDLRRFILAGMRHKGCGDRTVTVVYGKGSALRGWGEYPTYWGVGGKRVSHEGRRIQLTLPGPSFTSQMAELGLEPINYLTLAQVLEHEIDHTLGLEHKDMIDWWELQPTWHEGLSIEWHEPAKKAARQSAPEKREAHARAMLKKAETRLKRSKTIRDKWAKKVAYYERKKRG